MSWNNKNYYLRSSYRAECEREYHALLDEIIENDISSASELARYIRDNDLGYKYRKISGTVTMGNGNHSWDFENGIKPEYYARLCSDLGFGRRRKGCWAEGFTSSAQEHYWNK